jgi:hypothetical protein
MMKKGITMDWKDAFKKYMTNWRATPKSGLGAIRTHNTELFRLIEEALSDWTEGKIESFYTANGVQATFTFIDGKKYEITLKALSEKQSKQIEVHE